MTMIWCGLQRGVKIGGGRGDTEGDQTQINKHTHTQEEEQKRGSEVDVKSDDIFIPTLCFQP